MPTLVLLRHGQSQWNLENRFTGWWDVDVTEKGEAEARAAGQLLVDKGMDLDRVFTSVQKRAIRTANLTLEAMDRIWLPMTKDWRLNERHYGGLTGLNKAEMIEQFNKLSKGKSNAEARAIAKGLTGVDVHFDWDAPRTREGYYRVRGGCQCAINRAIAYAPYAI